MVWLVYPGTMSIHMNITGVDCGVFAARTHAPNAMRQGALNVLTRCVNDSTNG